ncbi:MAG: hypothetical protein HY719_03370 [Planctomycetes bacterium]|nr:hypothetical protein [Planctomycetota bacterium]
MEATSNVVPSASLSPDRAAHARGMLVGALLAGNAFTLLLLVLALMGFIGPGANLAGGDILARRLAASAGTTQEGNGLIVATGMITTDREALWVLDTVSRNLAVYDLGVGAEKKINYISGRKLTFDLQAEWYKGDKPSPKEVQKAMEDEQKKKTGG